MDIWLDDIRPAPEGWTWVTTAREVIDLLKTGEVEAVSLDNDLGVNQREGYTVVQWMEENDVWPELVCVHTNNPVAARYMREVLLNSGNYQAPVLVEFRVPLTNGRTMIFPATMFNHLTESA